MTIDNLFEQFKIKSWNFNISKDDFKIFFNQAISLLNT